MKDQKLKVLVIEDEDLVARFLDRILTKEGYDLFFSNQGGRGLEKVKSIHPDLIILDLGLPDRDGLELLMELKSISKAPIIVLTARDNDEDKVTALDSGAEDYLTKPFSTPELLARIRVCLRRYSPLLTGMYKNESLRVDFETNGVTIDDIPIKLTTTEFNILKILIKHEGKVVTYLTLLKEVWGPHSLEHKQYLRVYVGQLRKKLRLTDETKEFILTESGVGYRLIE